MRRKAAVVVRRAALPGAAVDLHDRRMDARPWQADTRPASGRRRRRWRIGCPAAPSPTRTSAPSSASRTDSGLRRNRVCSAAGAASASGPSASRIARSNDRVTGGDRASGETATAVRAQRNRTGPACPPVPASADPAEQREDDARHRERRRHLGRPDRQRNQHRVEWREEDPAGQKCKDERSGERHVLAQGQPPHAWTRSRADPHDSSTGGQEDKTIFFSPDLLALL